MEACRHLNRNVIFYLAIERKETRKRKTVKSIKFENYSLLFSLFFVVVDCVVSVAHTITIRRRRATNRAEMRRNVTVFSRLCRKPNMFIRVAFARTQNRVKARQANEWKEKKNRCRNRHTRSSLVDSVHLLLFRAHTNEIIVVSALSSLSHINVNFFTNRKKTRISIEFDRERSTDRSLWKLLD